MKDFDFDSVAEMLKALSHPVRLRIALGLTKKDDCNNSELIWKFQSVQGDNVRNCGCRTQVFWRLLNKNVFFY